MSHWTYEYGILCGDTVNIYTSVWKLPFFVKNYKYGDSAKFYVYSGLLWTSGSLYWLKVCTEKTLICLFIDL